MNWTNNTIDKSVVYDDLLGSFRESTNASIWAKAFVEHKNKNNWSLEDIDEDLMICWFSNAMIAMHDSILPNE